MVSSNVQPTPAFATTGATNTSSTQGSSQTQGSNPMNMNSFLTMFTTQLQYQDPTNPLQSYELAAQLAQFSTVSELSQIQQTMQTQQSYLSSMSNALMVNTIGKEVVGQDDSIQLQDGQLSKGSYTLSAPATGVTVKITDSNGNPVRTMQIGQQDAGSYDLSWDGLDDSGNAAPNGTYHFDVQAMGSDGNAMDIQKTISGNVTAFRVESGVPYLILGGANGIKLPISQIMEVDESGTA